MTEADCIEGLKAVAERILDYQRELAELKEKLAARNVELEKADANAWSLRSRIFRDKESYRERELEWTSTVGRLTQELDAARLRIAELERDGAAMAANQCLHTIHGDDYGNSCCPRIRELEREVRERLQALMEGAFA